MPSSITQSQLLPILAAIVAFLFAALLLVYIYRLLFGRRIKAPGPRNRPRRLDIVDTFDVDGDRQLVIVRRDNVEHLLLIGGPNDLLVEASISRVEAREPRPREKEAAGPGWPLGPAAPQAPAPVLPPLGPSAPSIESEAPKPEPAAPPQAPGLAPLPPDLFGPPPSKPPAPPAAPEAPARAGTPRFTPQRPPFTPTPRPPRPAPPPFLSRAAKPAPPSAVEPPPPAPELPPQEVVVEPPPPPPPPEEPPPAPPVDPLDSLEAEMARLLGRPESKP
ncbi:flagellar biosynthetic protein FliO [Methylosinus sp. KRF6]|uniref:flagellar biosynthetic protein FliO n=1 Tax=Methylosinus sp. KRF6 TaxID=2846853 RepID=UPI001C0C6A0B|nr:flagellar biosynthetic protein FliO [Methylosinus sp. KRF6]MBU3887247.1 flagellar biosynthetic protein FliO [Methylosinus sp. KRF6]